MAGARYTILVIGGVIKGAGVTVRDVFAEKEMFLFDVSYSHTIQINSSIATRVKEPEGIFMTTGAGLPLNNPELNKRVGDVLDRTARRFKIHSPSQMTAEQNAEIATEILRLCVQYRASESVAMSDPPKPGEDIDEWYRQNASQPILDEPDGMIPAGKTPRNAPCPCASGKKYKRCCGRQSV